MPRPERILLLRSGRHLQVALAALRAHAPGCAIAVVGTPGTERSIEQAGVPAGDLFIFSARPRFSPAAFVLSGTAQAVRGWGFTRVAVLWNDPDGAGQGNVDRTAFALAPRGFLAIAPDGRLIARRLAPQVWHEARRAMASLVTAAMLGALFLPAWLLPSRRR